MALKHFSQQRWLPGSSGRSSPEGLPVSRAIPTHRPGLAVSSRDSIDDDLDDPAILIEAEHQKPQLTLFDAIALLISLQIGSGIFSAPSEVNKHAPSPGVSLILWGVSGLLAWAGASCYAELGAALPVNGGTQEYLKYIYGDELAFLAAWIWIFAVKPPGMAILSIIASQYSLKSLFGPNIPANGWQVKLTAAITYLVVVVFNIFSVNATKGANKIFSVLKIGTLSLLLLGSLLYTLFGRFLKPDALNNDWSTRNWFSVTHTDWDSGVWASGGEFALGLYAGLFAYSGWDNINMVAGDLQDVGKNLPKAIFLSQPVVIFSFICANICYYIVIPWSEIDESNTIAVTAGERLMGFTGSLLFAILISLACIGVVNGNVYTASRVVTSAARAEWLPRSFERFSSINIPWRTPRSRPSEVGQTPIRAMMLNAALTLCYMAVGTFASLITFAGMAEYTFFTITVVGLLILRFREPNLPRPYKPNFIIPIIFTTVSFGIVLLGIFKAPIQAIVLCALMIAGLARRWVTGRVVRKSSIRDTSITRDRGNYLPLVRGG